MFKNMIAGVLFFLLILTVVAAEDDCTPAGGAEVERTFGKLPLYFIENQGQIDCDEVAYYVKGADKTLYFTKAGITFSLQGGDERWTVKLDFVGARPDAAPRGANKQEAVFSYFKGEPEDWKAGCPTYGKVVYEDLWPGIDLVFAGTVNRLKYEFVVEPGADPDFIRLAYRGATKVSTKESGELVVSTPMASFEDGKPYGYQEIDGERTEVSMAFHLQKDSKSEQWEYGFEIGPYDRKLPLVLDPEMLVYCGYIGGAMDDYGYGIAVDSSGAAYITGYTYSSESEGFPVLVGPDLTFNDDTSLDPDVFVAKLSPSGAALEYCGYIGGTRRDTSHGIAVDNSGAAYVTGVTSSSESEGFPVLVGPDLIHNGREDAFVAKLSPSGAALEYCGYIGGSDTDWSLAIALDSTGAAYIVGTTYSTESDGFPVLVGPDLTQNDCIPSSGDAYVAKVSPSGAALEYCGFIGGGSTDRGQGIAVDGSGAAHVTGYAYSSESENFPVLVGPDLTHNGHIDAFVAKVSASGAALEYCGYIGGEDDDHGWDIALNGAGAAYVTGGTDSSQKKGFPVLVGPDLTFNGSEDAFVARVSPSGAALEYCGYIGGEGTDSGWGIALDASGAAYVTGNTYSPEYNGFPVLVGPYLTYSSRTEIYVAKIFPSGAFLEYCGYIGGLDWEKGEEIAVDGTGAVYVTGWTLSTVSDGFPVLVGPYLTHSGGDFGADAFVAKVAPFAAPIVDIKANGEDGPLVLTTLDDITVTVSLDPRSLDGEPADFWIAVQKDGSATWWAQYRSNQLPKWTKSPTPIRFVGAFLRTVNNYTILGPRTLPVGSYVFFFAVDENKDGIVDASFGDKVKVTVN